MTKQIIYYRSKTNINTRNPLCEISQADHNHIIKVMKCYMDLAQADPRWQFEDWFMKSHELLPKEKYNNWKRNSPKSYSQGIINKLNQWGCDLSPQQCQGIEQLSKLISEWYSPELCPTIEFKTRLEERIDRSRPAGYDSLFN